MSPPRADCDRNINLLARLGHHLPPPRYVPHNRLSRLEGPIRGVRAALAALRLRGQQRVGPGSRGTRAAVEPVVLHGRRV